MKNIQRIKMFLFCILLVMQIAACTNKTESEIPDKINLEKVAFKYEIENIFEIIDKGIVVVGTVDKGTIYSDSHVLITDEAGQYIKSAVVSGLEAPPQGVIESATAGEPVGIFFEDVSKEEINIGFFIVIE